MRYANNVSAVDLERTMPGDIDIPRLQKGHLGGFFWYGFSLSASALTVE
jgi:membrane dipeptidase